METRTIVVLEGDDTGQELLDEALRVLASDVIDLDLDLPRFDLSLDSRRDDGERGRLRGRESGSRARPGV